MVRAATRAIANNSGRVQNAKSGPKRLILHFAFLILHFALFDNCGPSENEFAIGDSSNES
jgi:hypothetical protein